MRKTIIRRLIASFFTMTAGTATALASAAVPRKVAVTGAGGQTGQSLFRKMLKRPDEFDPIGIVRSAESKAALVDSGIDESKIVIADVTDADALKAAVGDKDISAFCICTSAKPAPTGEMNEETGRPVFGFPNGQPEQVDWMGQKNQIDSCPEGAHVVICSSMGGSDPNHPLNNLGKVTEDDGTTSGGDILKWKRKAELYLTEQSHLKYTIVHPGGLLNENGGERELVVTVDDGMDGTESRTVPREDVAEVMLQALRYPDAYAGRSFDLRAKPEGEGEPTTDFEGLLASLQGKNTDYTKGEIP